MKPRIDKLFHFHSDTDLVNDDQFRDKEFHWTNPDSTVKLSIYRDQLVLEKQILVLIRIKGELIIC